VKEFRRSPRLGPLSINAEFCFGGDRHPGVLTNVSPDGAFLATEEALPLGARLSVHLAFPRELFEFGTVSVEGLVVRRSRKSHYWAVERPGVGIAFVDLSSGARQTVELYIQQFLALTHRPDGPLRPNGERLFARPAERR